MNGFLIFFIFSLIIFLISLAVTLFGGIWPFDGTVKAFAELGRKVRGENCSDYPIFELGSLTLGEQVDLSCSDVFSDDECSEHIKDCPDYDSQATCGTKTLGQYYTNFASSYQDKMREYPGHDGEVTTPEELDTFNQLPGCLYVEELRDWDKVFKGIFE